MTEEFVVTHIRVETDRPFADVIREFEGRLGRFDPAEGAPARLLFGATARPVHASAS